MKHPKGNSERLRFLIIIFGVIVAITIILTPILPLLSGNELVLGVLFLVWMGGFVGLGFLVWGFLGAGWRHPKWYVKLFTAFCFIWEIFCAFVLLWTLGTGGLYGLAPAWSLFGSREPFIVILQTFVLAFPPLIPMWYWCYKEYRKEEPKRKEPKAWELEDQLKELKEQLGRGIITQEEYEQKRKKLLGKRVGRREEERN